VSQQQLNLGILAHVDAGKTTLTERLLYEAGVIDAVGSVDAGTTQTDSLTLERQRGITIKAAVTSFPLGDVHVNLIDTPGHPDFIAEVERVLSVLDGAVLVISAVEGVQPQTRILMRALQRLRIPTLLFVNKIDRAGADDRRTLKAISERLTPEIVPMGTPFELGTRTAGFTPFDHDDEAFGGQAAEVLAEHDEGIMSAFVEGELDLCGGSVRDALAAQTRRALVHPVFFGAAVTGAGVPELMTAIPELLPVATGDPEASVSATVFKIERGRSGEKIAYVRLFAGTIGVRDRLRLGGGLEDKVTALAVFDRGPAVQRASVSAGAVAKLWGLAGARIGDSVGERAAARAGHRFPPPTLESVVTPTGPDDGARLRVALAQLAEQDPLINVRQDDDRRELSVSLYGEVQKEVIQATLADDFGVDVAFSETTPLYVERPRASGEAIEVLHAESNPYNATIGLRVDPGPDDSGVRVELDIDHSGIPLYVYKRREHFTEAMTGYVHESLATGLSGWRVTDCVVTMTTSAYSVPDGPPSRRGPLSTAADFRKLTPLVLAQALERAGTTVCEPVVRAELEIPAAAVGAVSAALIRLGASVDAPQPRGELATIEAVLPALAAQELQRRLPELTGGEGVLESTFAGHRPVNGDRPARRVDPVRIGRR
jgi:ribosomal protection tetracycline resistance protein